MFQGLATMLNIVIVEDYTPLRESLVDAMAMEGHCVAGFDSAEALWRDDSLGAVDIFILDLNLPGADGISIARRMRAEYPGVGLLMLTARNAPDEIRIGYESGADIYLAKPISVMELAATVKALARRLKPVERGPLGLVLDTSAMTLRGPSGTVGLCKWEVCLLNGFTRSPNKHLEIGAIADLLDLEGDISKSAIEVRIVRLRKKMASAGATGRMIKAIRNRGYKLLSHISTTVTHLSSPV